MSLLELLGLGEIYVNSYDKKIGTDSIPFLIFYEINWHIQRWMIEDKNVNKNKNKSVC